jgi:hypothetical protein
MLKSLVLSMNVCKKMLRSLREIKNGLKIDNLRTCRLFRSDYELDIVGHKRSYTHPDHNVTHFVGKESLSQVRGRPFALDCSVLRIQHSLPQAVRHTTLSDGRQV